MRTGAVHITTNAFVAAACSIFGVGCSPGIPAAQVPAKTEVIAPAKWVGLCVKMSASDRRVSEAALALSSGDPELDKRMVADVIGLPVPGHASPEKWMSLRVADSEGRQAEAEAYDGPPFPDLDCEKFEKAPPQVGR